MIELLNCIPTPEEFEELMKNELSNDLEISHSTMDDLMENYYVS